MAKGKVKRYNRFWDWRRDVRLNLSYGERFTMFWVLNQITGLDEHGARTFSRVKEEFELDDAPAWNPPIRQAQGEQQEAFRKISLAARLVSSPRTYYIA